MAKLDVEEYNDMIFSRINNLISEYDLIKENELIAVALSGGKDSVLTLHALKGYQEFLDFDLVAISVDEGIKGYRAHGIDAAVNNARELGIELIQKSFLEDEGFALDDIYQEFKSACIPCGVFRRNILNKTAYEVGASKIATGHNLDDEIQSFLMSFARGDTIKFSKFGPELDVIHPKLVPRIKPLWNTPEKDVGTWAILNNIEIHLDECPYSHLSLRAKIKEFLNVNEDAHPGLKKNIMESFQKILTFENDISTNLNECEVCGEPTSSNICKACEIKKDLVS
ncbi:MAG: TIGR00269 family protein [Methanobrevibacter millerae]|uniref:TIGR00269 family protein n=1 Tax=Methanobrevibacter millerae TaxID=230361 RepID=A0A8T3VBU4_9EURY|nr:TIGR00269 family protein [Methanobrevibacter millerae]MBE6505599.1 TIGR00269 family protein [Methanobrevibacter millerae]